MSDVNYFDPSDEVLLTFDFKGILEHLAALTVSTPDDALSGEYDSDALSEVSYNSV